MYQELRWIAADCRHYPLNSYAIRVAEERNLDWIEQQELIIISHWRTIIFDFGRRFSSFLDSDRIQLTALIFMLKCNSTIKRNFFSIISCPWLACLFDETAFDERRDDEGRNLSQAYFSGSCRW